jgi:hypothetical protein
MMIAAIATALIDIEFIYRAITTAAEECKKPFLLHSIEHHVEKIPTNLVSSVYIAQ